MDRNGTSHRKVTAILMALLLLGIGALTIYAAKPRPSNGRGGMTAPQPAPETTTGLPGPALGTFIAKATPAALPAVSFQTADGTAVSLDAFRGKVVLLNLWATWCIPCRKEMPALDRLQAALGSADFEVVALSIDRSGIAGTRKFLDGVGVKNLKLYADPTARLANQFKAIGLPTTLLIDRQGREAGRLIGPAEWDSADAQALVRAAIAAK